MKDRLRELQRYSQRMWGMEKSCVGDWLNRNEVLAALASQPSDLRAKLEALRELSEKASPGMWTLQTYNNWHGFSVWAEGIGCVAERWEETATDQKPFQANGEFIVACVNAVRAILEGKD